MKSQSLPSLTLLLFLALLVFQPYAQAQQIAPMIRPIGQIPVTTDATAAPVSAPVTLPTTASAHASPETPVTVQFPHASIIEVLSYYEQLTGKKTIRDANLAGPELTIMAANQILPREAIALIESSLLLNNYTIIPVDDKTVKVLGPSHLGRAEGLPLYMEESQLPQEGDKLVSFYKPLHFLSPDEAITIITGTIPQNPYAAYDAVANTGAILITEKTPVIRKIIAILDVVDREPSQIITEFIPLQRANADKVVETLNAMFGGGTGGTSHPSTVGQPQGNQGASVTTGGDVHLLSGKPQFLADKRTNRVLIVVKAENYKYLRELIAKLDLPADTSLPLVRPLNYLSVNDLFPVLVDMLKGKDDADNGKSGSAGSTPAPTPRQNQNNSSQNGGTGSSASGSGGVANTGDKLSDPEQSAPQSATIGSTSIIGDPNANSIIVYGPTDTLAKAKEIIDLLDQRPKQVYLAAVIGQLQLTEGMDYGASWFAKLNTGNGNNLVGAAVNNSLSGLLTNLVTSSLNNAIQSFPSSLGGLTVFGTIAQGVATYAHFLESTGKFRTLEAGRLYEQ